MSGRYYRALSVMHRKLQDDIDDLERCPQPDWLRIGELKRLRLSIKDRMKSLLIENREVEPNGSMARSAWRKDRASLLGSEA